MGRSEEVVENKRIYQSRVGWWEVKMGGLLVFIILLLTLGNQLKHTRDLMGGINKPKPVVWRLIRGESLADSLGVSFREPWEMTETDLTLSRVVYNLLTKSGFRWLTLEVIAGMVASWMFIRGISWVIAWQWQQWHRLAAAASRVATATVRIQIAGTVEIVAKDGVIYASVTDQTSDQAQETYAFYFATVKISIVQAD